MESKPKNDLVRMIKKEEKVFIDKTGKANGRGVYLCDSKDCFSKAKKKKAINRGLNLDLTEDEMNQLFKDFFKEN